jgi:hypothetical protein
VAGVFSGVEGTFSGAGGALASAAAYGLPKHTELNQPGEISQDKESTHGCPTRIETMQVRLVDVALAAQNNCCFLLMVAQFGASGWSHSLGLLDPWAWSQVPLQNAGQPPAQ